MHFLPETISVDLHWCPLHQFILLTREPIPLNFAKKYWELTDWKNIGNFLSRPFWKFFCLIPWKAVKGSWVARLGRNYDDYPGPWGIGPTFMHRTVYNDFEWLLMIKRHDVMNEWQRHGLALLCWIVLLFLDSYKVIHPKYSKHWPYLEAAVKCEIIGYFLHSR